MNIIKRIGIEQHEVGCLISLYGTRVSSLPKFRGVSMAVSGCLHWSEASIDEYASSSWIVPFLVPVPSPSPQGVLHRPASS